MSSSLITSLAFSTLPSENASRLLITISVVFTAIRFRMSRSEVYSIRDKRIVISEISAAWSPILSRSVTILSADDI